VGRPWAELSSAERLDAILLAVEELNDERWGSAHAAAVAMRVQREHEMELPRMGRNGRANGMKRPSMAVRVTPGITMLRRRGLLTYTSRSDGYSGGADCTTATGERRVAELRANREEGKMAETVNDPVVAVREATGYEPDRPVLRHDDWSYGDRVRAIADDEDNGVFSGDEGYLILEMVGAPEYHNERVSLGLLAEGFSDPVDVDPDNIEPVD
jgi:hypothetical protein